MTAVVLDTNVVVSGHLKAGRAEAAVLQFWYARRIQLLVSEPVLAEYDTVLRRPKFGFSPVRVDEFLERVRQTAKHVTPTVKVSVCPDPDDNRFLECAVTGSADAFVTGNKRHFPPREFQVIPILNASEFLARFAVSEALRDT